MSTNQYQRLIEKDVVPTENQISAAISSSSLPLWNDLKEFLITNYDFEPELIYYGKKYGWCFRYRRKGKTLCGLFPETRAFTVLVVLGKKEIEHVNQNLVLFNEDTQTIFKNAHQYHDGKWIYKRVLNQEDLNDVQSLIKIKKPLKQ